MPLDFEHYLLGSEYNHAVKCYEKDKYSEYCVLGLHHGIFHSYLEYLLWNADVLQTTCVDTPMSYSLNMCIYFYNGLCSLNGIHWNRETELISIPMKLLFKVL